MSAPAAVGASGCVAGPGSTELRVAHENGIITVSDANTTLGYCRYAEDGEVEYLFVQASKRRQGLAMQLLHLVEQHLGTALRFRGPLSPMGRGLVDAYLKGHPQNPQPVLKPSRIGD